MDLLDRLYNTFDKITAKHALFKVETIGDAYMVCGNILEDGQSPDHTARVGEFALDLVRAAGTVEVIPGNSKMGCVQIRAGFHSGKIVASVVGNATPRFCLFGDTARAPPAGSLMRPLRVVLRPSALRGASSCAPPPLVWHAQSDSPGLFGCR